MVSGLDDRRRGALLGLAIGDALGAAVEFRAPGSFEPVTGFRAGGPHGLNAGEWTDDTSLALAMADSIVQVGWDLNDQARRYVVWWKQGEYSVNGYCFDIGGTTQNGLAQFEQTGDASTSGPTDEWASGNGSIMRLAPVPIRYVHLFPERVEELAEYAAASSLPTHGAPLCLSACRYFGVLLAGLMHSENRKTALSPNWPPLERVCAAQPLHPKIEEVARGSFRKRQPPQIVGSGYVVQSLEAALWAFWHASSFSEAVLAAVNLGDDADTTGAVCGQLAGAHWGESGIPTEWLDTLARRDMLNPVLDKLLR